MYQGLEELAREAEGLSAEVFWLRWLRELELVCQEATAEAGQRVSFANLLGRISYLADAKAVDTDTLRPLHDCRMAANRVMRGQVDAETGFSRQGAIGALVRFCEAVTGFAAPAGLKEELSGKDQAIDVENILATALASLPPAREVQRPKAEQAWRIRCLVLEVGPTISQAGRRQVAVRCLAEDCQQAGLAEGEAFTLYLQSRPSPDRPGQDLYDYTPLAAELWPYATLQVINVTHWADRPGHYYCNQGSQFVLEPDYLLDVSELSRTVDHTWQADPRRYLLRLWPVESPAGQSGLFRGSIVNDLLDALLEDPEADYKTCFERQVHENFIKIAATPRAELAQIYKEIELAFLPNLRQFARELPGRERAVAEASFVSAHYGMAGRMDVLVPGTEPGHYDTYELKSGKPKAARYRADPADAAAVYQPWPEHEAQQAIYDILLEAMLQEQAGAAPGERQRHGLAALLYPRQSAAALRVEDWNLMLRKKRTLLLARNQIVALLHRLRQDPAGTLAQLRLETLGESTDKFAQGPIRRLQTGYLESGDEQLKAYYALWLGFMLAEFACAKTGQGAEAADAEQRRGAGYSSLWRDCVAEKTLRFEIAEALTYGHCCERGWHHLVLPEEAASHAFREGDIVILYPDGEQGRRSRRLMRGAVRKVSATGLALEMKGSTVQMDASLMYTVEPDFMESSHWAMTAALFDVMEVAERPTWPDLLLGRRAPAQPMAAEADTEPTPEPAWSQPNLTDHQRALIRAAVAAPEYYLLQGPPGTGKTSTALTEIVWQELAAGRRNVVVLCFTTRAVDEVEHHLARLNERLTGQGRAALRTLSLRRKARTPEELEALLGLEAHGQKRRPLQARLAEALAATQVFCCTITSFYANRAYLQRLLPGGLDLLIVDEASQTTEPQLAGLLPHFAKFILIGDQRQLPPVVGLAEARCRLPDAHVLRPLGFEDMRDSLFDRLWRRALAQGWHWAQGTLTEHFRMHEDLAALINPYYGGRLRVALPRQRAPFSLYLDADLPAALAQGRALFLESGPAPTGKQHPDEAALAADLLAAIHRACPGLSLGVVTPWRAQAQAIRQALLARGLLVEEGLAGADAGAVKVDTVERFQGGERDVILISTALHRRQSLRGMQSLSPAPELSTPANPTPEADRKLIVALSRAREQVILLGHRPYLQADAHYGPLIERMKSG